MERELIVQSSRLRITMYVCMYAVMLRECNYVFTHAHTGTMVIHALSGRVAPRPDKVRVKLEQLRLTRMLDVSGGGDRR